MEYILDETTAPQFKKFGVNVFDVDAALSDIEGARFAVFFGREQDSYQPGLIRMGRITSDLSLFGKLGESPEVRIEVKK